VRETSPGSDKRSLAAVVAIELRHRIATGDYPVNSLLPSEQELAEEFHTSRRTSSAALAQLSKEGLVRQVRRRGTRVVSPQEWLQKDFVGIVYGPSSCYANLPLSRTPENGPLIEGVEETLTELGYTSRLLPQDKFASSVDDIVGRFGALIFIEAAPHISDLILQLERRRFPLVVANLEHDLEVSATWVDHAKAVRTAVHLLAALGHRRIAYVGTESSLYFYAQTHRAFLDAMQSLGLSLEPELVRFSANSMPLDAYMAARPLLSLPEPPTAIVAARDSHAEGVCRAMDEAGLSLGRDISVIGFDDEAWPEGRAFLTTFQEPTRKMGVVAAKMLASRLVSGWHPPEKRELDAPLILRRSAGPPPPRKGAEKFPTVELFVKPLAATKSPSGQGEAEVAVSDLPVGAAALAFDRA